MENPAVVGPFAVANPGRGLSVAGIAARHTFSSRIGGGVIGAVDLVTISH
jgi:hypothetical protein